MADRHAPVDHSNTPRPTASVALAAYNGASFISAQLDSILEQTEPPDEIVVTDDQSTDGTLDILDAYAARASVPIRIHRNAERLGYARNFGRAVSLCRSELIFFSDQDDVWAPTKVERMKAAFTDPAVLLAYHGALVVNGKNEPLYRLYDAGEQRARLATEPIYPWHASYGLTQAFRASLREYDDLWGHALHHIHCENELLPHDQWFFFIAQVLGRVAYIDEDFVEYRQHSSNAVGAMESARPSAFWQRLRQQFSHDPRIDRMQSDAAYRRAEILDEIGRRNGSAVAERTTLIGQSYRLLAARLMRRYSVYTSARLSQRVANFSLMISHSDYGLRPWHFRKRGMSRDVIQGVLQIVKKNGGHFSRAGE